MPFPSHNFYFQTDDHRPTWQSSTTGVGCFKYRGNETVFFSRDDFVMILSLVVSTMWPAARGKNRAACQTIKSTPDPAFQPHTEHLKPKYQLSAIAM